MVDKLFQFNPRAITDPPKISFLLEARSTTVLIIKPRLVHVAHTYDLSRTYVTSNLQGQMFVQNLIVSKPNVTPGRILYCTEDCIPVELMFHEYFPSFYTNRSLHLNIVGLYVKNYGVIRSN